jgi:hypothetical protein
MADAQGYNSPNAGGATLGDLMRGKLGKIAGKGKKGGKGGDHDEAND